MRKHYSVRKSVQYPGRYKIVLAGGWCGYSDLDLPLFDTLEDALRCAERLERLRKSEEA